MFARTLHSTYIACLVTKNKNQLDALISQIYFWNKIIHVSDRGTVRNM